MRALILLLAMSATALIGACDLLDKSGCPDGMERWVEYELYMGRSGSGGEVVSDTDWDAFLADIVTPRFPNGLTVLDGRGQWRNGEGQIEKERSKVLLILAPNDDEDADDLIDEVASEYKAQFDQESVLKTVDKTCLSFE